MSDINYPGRALNSAIDSVSIAGSITASNPSVAPTGAAVPAQATYIAVDVSGNLTGLVGTANGLKVDGSAVTQPVSGTVNVQQATAANLNATVTGTVAATQSGTWSNSITQGGNTATVTASNALKVDGSAVTQPISGSVTATVSGTVAATQSGTWDINNISGSVSLPTGAATAAKQPALGTAGTASADVITVQGIASMTALKVDGSAVTQPVSIASVPAEGGRSKVLLATISYSSTNVTTSAYTQITASTSGAINRLYIADTSGSALIIAVGGAGSENDQLYVGPGGSDAPYELNIPSGSRLSIKALDANATSGRLILTALS